MRSTPVAPAHDGTPGWLDWLWIAAASLWCVTAADRLGATFDEPLYRAHGLEGWRSGGHAGLLRLGTMPLPADLQTLPIYAYERWQGVKEQLRWQERHGTAPLDVWYFGRGIGAAGKRSPTGGAEKGRSVNDSSLSGLSACFTPDRRGR